MPPKKQKQTASANASVSSNENMPSLTAPQAMVPTKTGDEQTRTPERSPEKRGAMQITEAQKQALMDNLQLEVTERARKLRAQYALQAQGLRARLEMRVNRIPQALRKRNMQDLMDEHADRANMKPAAPKTIVDSRQNVLAPTSVRRSLKRTSEHFGSDNKENSRSQEDLTNPKKRTKTATTTTSTADSKPSRKGAQPTVLSPKSHNPRAQPRLPLKPAAADKLTSSIRPASPFRPGTSHSMVASSSPYSRGPSRLTQKRPATARTAALASESRDSEDSSNSAGTTIITKPGAKKAAPARKAPAAKAPTATATKRAAGVKKEPVAPAPAAGGRTLRKRG